MYFQKEKVLQSLVNLNKTVVMNNMVVENITVTDFCPYKKDNTPPHVSEFHPYNNEFIDFPTVLQWQ